jgi:hypothetical protein
MSPEDPGKVPLVSAEIFNDLQADLEDPGIAHRYLLEYLQMWEGRFLRLSAAIRTGNAEAGMDAVLSVRTSARMIGALRLAHVAADIEQDLAAGDMQGAAQLLDQLEVCGRFTMEELRRRFLPQFGPTAGRDELEDPQAPGPGPEGKGWLRRADSLLADLAPTRWEPRLN